MGHTTVGEYLQRANAAGLSWPLPEELSDADIQGLLFPVATTGDPCRPLPDWNLVRKDLGRKGVTLLLLWQEYIEGNSDGYGYSRFAELYHKWLEGTDLRMLQRQKAGEKLFVDWAGPKMDVTDPKTGEVASASIFVSAMGSSQFIFATATASDASIVHSHSKALL